MLAFAAHLFEENQKQEPHTLMEFYKHLILDSRLPPDFSEHHFLALLESSRTASIFAQEYVPSMYNGFLLVFVATLNESEKAERAF